MKDNQRNKKFKTTKKIKMEDNQKNQDERRPNKFKIKDDHKKFKLEDEQENSKWKTTTTTKIQNRRQPKIVQNGGCQESSKWIQISQQPNSKLFKNKIVQIGCGSAPGNLV